MDDFETNHLPPLTLNEGNKNVQLRRSDGSMKETLMFRQNLGTCEHFNPNEMPLATVLLYPGPFPSPAAGCTP